MARERREDAEEESQEAREENLSLYPRYFILRTVVINERNVRSAAERSRSRSQSPRQSERRRIAHRRSRSLSFNSQSFDTAVPGCPQVVRKIPRIVFIQIRGRRV
ncbi:hypothetical protein PUN28_010328 [Cardiocondyla obscurior]|uniref:Uncharacterized protein n=1 Tax=Cardiocondyla obscurior TaxID=286306 RepID=A0AAW2FNQ6_9HYME